MPYIHLTTFISASPDRVFDLSRSVELHKHSMKHTGEQAVAGTITGLLKLDDTVTWTGKHLFRQRRLTTRITKMQRPDFFVDEQTEGDFTLMKHEHYFKPIENGTLMIDQLRFEVPYGGLGKLLNRLYLEKYMTRLLEQRNALIKSVAEGNQWRQYVTT